MIYLASDHGGFKLKEKIKKYFEKSGIDYQDMGNLKYDENDDYPDFAIKAINKVLENPVENKAILMCKSGTGELMVANRFKGIRATLSWNKKHARKSREDDNTNVLALPAEYIKPKQAIGIINSWLNTKFSGAERHIRRLKKIENIK